MNLLIIDKSEGNCQIIEAASAEDGRTRGKEDEKVEKNIKILRENSERCGE